MAGQEMPDSVLRTPAPSPVRRDEGLREREIERACELMHDAYEAAALGEGWETQPRSRGVWADVPEANKATMRAAVGALYAAVVEPLARQRDALREHNGQIIRERSLALAERDALARQVERVEAILDQVVWREKWAMVADLRAALSGADSGSADD